MVEEIFVNQDIIDINLLIFKTIEKFNIIEKFENDKTICSLITKNYQVLISNVMLTKYFK